ncbi:adenosylcobinamide-GDP ribazoletransferase [bacterium]|nr:adenosylcobinamide-GDP ribazoletransferase [bacterium]
MLIQRFWAALSILSLLPAPRLSDEAYRDSGALLSFAPLVGAVISLLCTLSALSLYALAKNPSPWLAAAVFVIAEAFLTRGFHLDGLADTFDGFGGGWNKERILEIMRDHAIGSFGALALISALLLKTVCLASVWQNQSLPAAILFSLLVPVFSRTVMVYQAAFNVYARDSQSLAGNVVNGTQQKHFLYAAGLALFIAAAALAALGLKFPVSAALEPIFAAVLSGFAAAALLGLISRRKIGGVTGDVLGASVELSEAVMLTVLALF